MAECLLKAQTEDEANICIDSFPQVAGQSLISMMQFQPTSPALSLVESVKDLFPEYKNDAAKQKDLEAIDLCFE